VRRREFIAGLGSTAVWPVAGRAQQVGKVARIGFYGATTPSAQNQWTDAFVQRLRELDWVEGRSVAIEYQWANGVTEHAGDVFAEFVRRKVDVIVTHSVPLTAAAKRATSQIPIVFAVAADPVDTGLVASLSRPGGNVTGMSLQLSDATTKRIELLREVVRGLRRWSGGRVQEGRKGGPNVKGGAMSCTSTTTSRGHWLVAPVRIAGLQARDEWKRIVAGMARHRSRRLAALRLRVSGVMGRRPGRARWGSRSSASRAERPRPLWRTSDKLLHRGK
jgi:hypothetical protein